MNVYNSLEADALVLWWYPLTSPEEETRLPIVLCVWFFLKVENFFIGSAGVNRKMSEEFPLRGLVKFLTYTQHTQSTFRLLHECVFEYIEKLIISLFYRVWQTLAQLTESSVIEECLHCSDISSICGNVLVMIFLKWTLKIKFYVDIASKVSIIDTFSSQFHSYNYVTKWSTHAIYSC